MRSSKSRSRSKSNRQRSLGNIVNRVFDSSGPEGKVRGTPQQIIDKYLMLARDAQLSNDRVAEQNFLQHAEHYTRMLGEAMREMQREQESRQQHHQDGGQGGGYNSNGNGNGQNGNGGYGQPATDDRGERPAERAQDRGPQDRGPERGNQERGQQNRRRDDQRGERSDRAPERGGEDYRRSALLGDDRGDDEGPGLVETPEARLAAVPTASMMPDLSQAPEASAAPGADAAAPKPAQRRPRKPRAKADEGGETVPAPTDEQG